jgi:hypothetical protein
MERNWIFATNTFESNTRNNYKRMLTLTLDHYGKLVLAAASNPAFVPLRDEYEPFHLEYQNAYNAWVTAGGVHEGSTLSVEELLEDLNTKLRGWEATVRYVYQEDSPQERSIFPNKRAPYQSGTYEQRISAVKGLALHLATFTTEPLLVTLSGDVMTFYDTIEAARVAQTGNELGISSRSAALERARVNCAIEMYGNMGRIMYIYRENPVEIEQFWDLSLLRNTTDNTFSQNVSVNPTALVTVGLSPAQRDSIDANTIIKITNTSTAPVPLKVGFSTAAGEEPTFTATVEPEMMRELSASELGWSSEKKFLTIRNESPETGTATVQVDL